jgi:cytoskeleton protein RodZ
MTADAGGGPRQSGIGARLRGARERAGLTLAQVAEQLHLDLKSVLALESEEFAFLGAPVFTRGHIRHYSDLVGENSDELVALYNESAPMLLPDAPRVTRADPLALLHRFMVPALLALIGVLLLIAAWWALRRH